MPPFCCCDQLGCRPMQPKEPRTATFVIGIEFVAAASFFRACCMMIANLMRSTE